MTMSPPSLLADIGGTNARFARRGPDGLEATLTLSCLDYDSLHGAVEAYLDETSDHHDHPRPERAAFAVAAMIEGDTVELTNHDWRFSIAEMRAELGLEQLVVVNDFSALALAIPMLQPGEQRRVGGGEAVAGAPTVVVGPGTGLGVAGLVTVDGQRVALEGEGGHAGFAPASELEVEVLRRMMRRYGRVSAERVLSGRGLEEVYNTLCLMEGHAAEPRGAAQIAARGVEESGGPCRQALEFFCGALGSFAGDLALTYNAAGGVYIGGGIVPRFADFFAKSSFRDRFEHKGRFSKWMRKVPSTLITARTPGLTGAAVALERTQAQSRAKNQ